MVLISKDRVSANVNKNFIIRYQLYKVVENINGLTNIYDSIEDYNEVNDSNLTLKDLPLKKSNQTITYEPKGKTYLKSAGKYNDLVGQELRDKHFKSVLSGQKQVYTYRLRRGLKINFISK